MDYLILLFIFGLLVGSFLNVVSFRYKPGGRILFTKNIKGRSHCSNCKTNLKWYELIPLISFFIQGFKCRHCEHSLSWQYPGVEFLVGIITAALPTFLFYQLNIQSLIAQNQSIAWFILLSIIWLLVAYTFIVLSIIDFRHRIIPDQGNILLFILGIIILGIKYLYPSNFLYQGSFLKSYVVVFGQQPALFVNILLALGLAIVLFGGIILLTRGKGMGMGDLKMAIPIAFLLSWPDVIISFIAAFVVGSLFGIILIMNKVKNMKQAVPFGPFLAIGVGITIFYGETVLRWYFSLI